MFKQILSSQSVDYILDGKYFDPRVPTILERNGFVLESFLAWQKVNPDYVNFKNNLKKLRDMYDGFSLEEQVYVEYGLDFSIGTYMSRGQFFDATGFLNKDRVINVVIRRSYCFCESGQWQIVLHSTNIDSGKFFDSKPEIINNQDKCYTRFLEIIKTGKIEQVPIFTVPEAEHSLNTLLKSDLLRKERFLYG